MAEAESHASGPPAVLAGTSLTRLRESASWSSDGRGAGGSTLRDVAARRWVLLSGLAFIGLDIAWRAQLLSGIYFRQDDYQNLDFAIKSPLNWHYLSFIGWGHFMIGLRLIAWVLARVALYDWPLASAIVLAFLGCAGLAALRLLRTLFGERPGILIPLALYLLCPLTLPSLGFWSAALESVPLQLAIFMALDAHVRYVRTGRARHLAGAAIWVGFGLIFFEKAIVLPLLLYAVTAAFLVGRTSVWAGARDALRRYWRAWVVYLLLLAAYSVLLMGALPTSQVRPQAPPSVGAVATFSWGMVKDTLLPGALGGPWQWYPAGPQALAAAPAELAWLALLVAAAVMIASVVRRTTAWRAWAILGCWVVLADMVPVAIARLTWYPVLRALDAHYVSDAVPVLALCLGLAFLPIAGGERAGDSAPARSRRPAGAEAAWQRVAAGLLAIFVFGSWWSARTYASVSSGSWAANYIANARQAAAQAPAGTRVVDMPVPPKILYTANERAYASTVIGDLAPGKFRWISTPSGTIDGLRIFGPDGRLYLAQVQGAGSPAGNPCWPQRHGQIIVRFWKFSPTLSNILRISYLWGGTAPEDVVVHYGTATEALRVRPGANVGYLRVSGRANFVVIDGVSGGRLCVGDSEAGLLAPDPAGPILPRAQP